jgi:NDP-sugar pyrophosphorylase family protein
MTLPAVILVGGEGTRLRPLTDRTPKPMLPLLDRPLLSYTFDHLRGAGVDRAVLACGYLPTQITRYYGTHYDGLALDYRVEPQPLGTAGAIRFGAQGIKSTFLALNGDSLREADLTELVSFHRERGAMATILLTRVADPARYGLVRTEADGRVAGFVEKPEPGQIDTETINAGVYVLEPEVLEMIDPDRSVSIEREIFPQLVEQGTLYALDLPGYWLDVGTRTSYLQAHLDLLNRKGNHVDHSAKLGEGVVLLPPVSIGAGVRVDAHTCIGPFVHLGTGSRVGRRSIARWTAVLPRAEVADDTRVVRAIVAPGIGALQS